MNRTLSISELRHQLQEQLHLLQSYCAQFDAGDWSMSKPMSATLRTLLHHPDNLKKPSQGSLLAQLRLRSGFWVDSTRVFGMPKGGPWSWPQILVMQMGEQGTGFQPKLLGQGVHLKKTSFLEWWGQKLIDHPKFGPISRKKLVTGMADQDGGAHVDGQVNAGYDAFSRGEYFDITIGEKKELAIGATRACSRTIAHETMLTISRYAPQAIVTRYQWKALGEDVVNSLP